MKAVNFILAASALVLLLIISPAADAYTVVAGHPRVDIRPSDIPTLATRAYGSDSSEYSGLKSWCDSNINISVSSLSSLDLGYHMEAYAFIYLVEKQRSNPQYQSYSNRVKSLMSAMPAALGDQQQEQKRAFARAFDWIYPELTASDKGAFVPKLRTMIDYTLPIDWRSGTHTQPRHSGPLVHLGLALYDDDRTKALESLDKARWWLIDTSDPYRHVDNWNEAASDGAMYAGDYSHTNGLRWPAEWVHAWDKGTDGEELIAKFDHLKNASLFYSYSVIPNYQDFPLADGDLYYTYKDTGVGMYICASMYNDGRAEWVANQVSKTWIYPNYWHYVLWDKKITPVLPDDLPKSHFFDTLGAVYMRSGWNLSGTSTDVISNFRCSKRVDWHAHCDQASFEIRRGTDYLAIDSGWPNCIKGLDPPGEHFADYLVRTVAHNTMLIFKPDEIFKMASFGARKNDGGQQWVNRDGPFPIGSRLPGGANARGFIEGYSDAPTYTYSYADATSAYSSTGNDQGVNTKISNFTRQYIYLKDRFFVVFDRVNSLDNPPATIYEKRWLLHSIKVPQIEDSGSWNGGTTPNSYGGTPGTTSSNTSVLSVSQGTSKLYINTLYPQSHITRKVGGPSSSNTFDNASSFEFYHNGSNNYSTWGSGPSERDGRWRIEVSPSGSDVRRDNIFLHVLEPVASTATRTPTDRIEDSTNGFYGTYIRHATEPWVVMCSGSEQLKQTVSYTISASGRVRHLICDLAKGTGQYNVYRNGQLIVGSPFTVTDANTLYFEADGGGTFTVSQGPPPPAPVITINSVTTPTATSMQTITGTKTTDVQTVRVNGSASGVTITSSTTWSYTAQLVEGSNTFHITAHDSSGTQVGSADTSITLDSVPPNAPTNLTAPTITDASISLAWNPPAPASDKEVATSYIVKRNGVQVGAPTSASYADTRLTPLTNYSYQVLAVDDVGNVSTSGASGAFTTLATPSFKPVSVNFEQPISITPSGFLKDSGQAYDSGRGYGWDVDVSANTRDREMNSDQKLDTFIYTTSAIYTWEFSVPNGAYLISLASGDAFAAGPHRVKVEGLTVINDQSTIENQYIYVTKQPVTVADGRLTVNLGGTTGRTCLNYILVESQGTGADTDPPTFFNINITPSRLSTQPGFNTTTITFTASETLSGNPSVKVGTNDATFKSKSGNDYTYTYTATGSETQGMAVVVRISGTDLAGNQGLNTSGLLQFDFTPPAPPGGLIFGS